MPPDDALVPAPAFSAPGATSGAAGSSVSLDEVKRRWPAVLDDLRRANYRTLEALVRDMSEPVEVEPGNVVVLKFRFPIHARRVQEVSNQIAVEKALGRVLNRACKVRCVVEEGSEARAEQPRSQSGPHDPVVAKALRIWRARILEPAERAAVEALPTISIAAMLDR
jgi:hypothetical protein